jgi:3-phosphoshikimate 1-carboxyvinyltransferase
MSVKSYTKSITSCKKLSGKISVPGDKSISHRALILGSLAQGKSEIQNIAPGKDCTSTLRCLRSLGVKVTGKDDGSSIVHIEGCGYDGLSEAKNVLNAGNSATTMRLLCGVLAAQPFTSLINGDSSLRSRPMDRVISPLRQMGSMIYGRNNNRYAPLFIKGSKLHGITYELPVASAQIKSAILLAGLFASGITSIKQKAVSRDHTELMLRHMGVQVVMDDLYLSINQATAPLSPLHLFVPGDISSAAYWFVAGALHPDAEITITGCGINPTRAGIIEVLKQMGTHIEIKDHRLVAGEQIADIHIQSSRLHAAIIDKTILPRVIDEIPVLAVAACLADGDTIIRDASELRIKESDRISSTVKELTLLGAKIEELPDGMIIHGSHSLNGAVVDSHNDHRLAMSLAIAGLVTKGTVRIHNAQAIDISYPSFWQDLEKLSSSQ